ncbi:cupin domain-containing protein, partial [Solirhodobacter olei]|uniref:cupin domain-containing protein n=1 Tax=Solirhodobacter olei TaxID=2493082 RepID=UPI0019D43AD9
HRNQRRKAMKVDVNRPEEGDALWVVADRIRFLGGLPGSELELLEVEVPAGSGTPPHSHASAEMFYIVEGELTVRQFPGATEPPVVITASPGAAVRIASGIPHNYANESGRTVRMVVLIEQTMIAFFRDIGTAEAQEQPDFARIGAAMERHGIDVLNMAA